MSTPQDVTLVVAAEVPPPAGWVGRFEPGHPYSAAWLSVLGPTPFVLWDHLARGVTNTDGRPTRVVVTSIDELGRTVGVPQPARMQRALSRLRHYRLVVDVGGGDGHELRVQARLPLLPGPLASRLPGALQDLHRAFGADLSPSVR